MCRAFFFYGDDRDLSHETADIILTPKPRKPTLAMQVKHLRVMVERWSKRLDRLRDVLQRFQMTAEPTPDEAGEIFRIQHHMNTTSAILIRRQEMLDELQSQYAARVRQRSLRSATPPRKFRRTSTS